VPKDSGRFKPNNLPIHR